jgi:hypothetical protein
MSFVRVMTTGVGVGIPGGKASKVGILSVSVVGWGVGVWDGVAVGSGGLGVAVGVFVGIRVGVLVGGRLGDEVGVGNSVWLGARLKVETLSSGNNVGVDAGGSTGVVVWTELGAAKQEQAITATSARIMLSASLFLQ